ncbi:MAG: zinc-dependent metalloprotease, partial [Mycobacteriaceae bacterium]
PREGSGAGGGGFGFGAGGFDPSALGQMLTQLGQMLSTAGAAGQSAGPVNYDLARQLAEQQLGTVPAVSDADTEAALDALRLAEIWLDDATTLPAGTRTSAAWTAKDWLTHTMPTWQRLCDPVAAKMASAWVEGMPEEAKQMLGPMMGMMSQMGGMAFGSQLGQALSQLAGEVLTSTDIGLPLGPEGTAALMPAAISTFTDGLDRPRHEVLVYLAAREAAHQRLFGHVPWLRQRLLATVEEYASGISVDFSAIEDMARNIDPSTLSDPAALEKVLGQGTFGPTTSPAQTAALQRLETLLALVEGWVDHVVSEAVQDRLPGAAALRETLRRRRASGGPAEATFATLVGLELRPRRLRDAAELWRLLSERGDAATRDAVWAHPDLLPSAADLDDPVAFAERFLMSHIDGSSDDPMAELERTIARERAEKESGEQPGTEGAPD